MSERLECDLVMCGGITSGIVYPLAVAELSKTYDFRSIGGTSAGALAAVVTAAAAHGRRTGKNPAAFDKIADIPKVLASPGARGGTVLESLFVAQPGLERVFRIVKAFIAPTPEQATMATTGLAYLAFVRSYPSFAFLGLLPGSVVCIASAAACGDLAQGFWLKLLLTLAIAVGIVVALLGAGLVSALAAGRDVAKLLPGNMYGLCAGLPPEGQSDPTQLTAWLHEQIQGAAGLPSDDVLTVGDLASHDHPRPIALNLITSNVTLCRSSMFPVLENQDLGDEIYFLREDLAQLLPAKVVDHMVTESQGRQIKSGKTYYRLPARDKLPVVFGARISLSFPFLLAAFPLYHRDWSAKNDEPLLRRCWYSDGGLTSNFPIHLFDSPIPMRPTFAINLVAADPALRGTREAPWDYISMATRNEQRGLEVFNAFDEKAATAKSPPVIGFVWALINTARKWQDSQLILMPGYQDRIVNVHLDEQDEGGYRLNMPKETVLRVSARGGKAGELLAARFSGKAICDPRYADKPIELNWENHRRVRFRATFAALEVYLKDIRKRWVRSGNIPPARHSYRVTANRPAMSYPFAQQKAAYKDITKLMRTIATFNRKTVMDETSAGATPETGRAPKPGSRLGLHPSKE